MKKALLPVFFLFSLNNFAQLTSFYFQPHAMDTAYSVNDDSNLVIINPSVTALNKLLVFLPGTGAKTKHYTLFPELAANLGYHCLSVAYPNGYPTVAMLCAGNSDTDCYYHLRQEVCYGTDVSPDVDVDTLHSIYTRICKSLLYLAANYPGQGWDQYMNNGALVWNKIIVSGHSQGGGHALYLAHTQGVERMIMFAGADDYSDYYGQPANWTFIPGVTPFTSYFSFLHLNDDVWDYSKQFAIVQATGMTSAGDDSTIVDNASDPYSNSHCLYTAVPPLFPGIYSSYHDGPVVDVYTPKNGGIPVYTPVWTYMLTSPLPLGQNELSNKEVIRVFPNPASDKFHIKTEFKGSDYEYVIYDELSIEIKRGKLQNNDSVGTEDLSNGVYLLRINNKNFIRLIIAR